MTINEMGTCLWSYFEKKILERGRLKITQPQEMFVRPEPEE
jgi:hypothetical protein